MHKSDDFEDMMQEYMFEEWEKNRRPRHDRRATPVQLVVAVVSVLLAAALVFGGVLR